MWSILWIAHSRFSISRVRHGKCDRAWCQRMVNSSPCIIDNLHAEPLMEGRHLQLLEDIRRHTILERHILRQSKRPTWVGCWDRKKTKAAKFTFGWGDWGAEGWKVSRQCLFSECKIGQGRFFSNEVRSNATKGQTRGHNSPEQERWILISRDRWKMWYIYQSVAKATVALNVHCWRASMCTWHRSPLCCQSFSTHLCYLCRASHFSWTHVWLLVSYLVSSFFFMSIESDWIVRAAALAGKPGLPSSQATSSSSSGGYPEAFPLQPGGKVSPVCHWSSLDPPPDGTCQ